MVTSDFSLIAGKIKPFLVMEILDRAKQLEEGGKDIIHLGIGEPDFKTPEVARRAAIEAIEGGLTGYTHSLGLSSLRQAICDHYQKEHNVKITPERIIVSSGTSPLLLLTLATMINPGDEVILTNPCYACYPNFVVFLGGKCSFVDLDPETGFDFQAEKIKISITNKTKAIIINSPSNPTGMVIKGEELEMLSQFGPKVISDEIYHGLVYEDKARSFLEFSDEATIINGFSKLYAMSGWRIGFAISDEKRIRAMQKIQQNFFISASNFGQQAATAALNNAEQFLPEMLKTYSQRRTLLLEELPKIGFKIHKAPTGAFYILADAREFCKSSYDFAFELLEKTGVAVTPGIDFGQNAEGFIRFSYTNSIERIKEAVLRLKDYLAKR